MPRQEPEAGHDQVPRTREICQAHIARQLQRVGCSLLQRGKCRGDRSRVPLREPAHGVRARRQPLRRPSGGHVGGDGVQYPHEGRPAAPRLAPLARTLHEQREHQRDERREALAHERHGQLAHHRALAREQQPCGYGGQECVVRERRARDQSAHQHIAVAHLADARCFGQGENGAIEQHPVLQVVEERLLLRRARRHERARRLKRLQAHRLPERGVLRPQTPGAHGIFAQLTQH
mmetsp:Transcript_38384/g.95057  ORF Transcript_38384/g.95057 Transcript_38384/m.95057 type:complete len:234 (-) Transcript_38384:155-856(-)